jgi:8-hydroxy-5-deazaflavin:NADPH oxidoreductase
MPSSERPNTEPSGSTSPTSTGAGNDIGTIGFIGSGNIGSTLARLAVAAGYDVVLSNRRGPQTLTDLVAELGPRARAATPAEAAAAGDLVVVTIPLHAYRQVPVEPLRGKVVVDTDNYYPDGLTQDGKQIREPDNRIPELDDESTTTSELLQTHLPESFVVKGFNHIVYPHLATLGRPADDPDRSALIIAGDDAAAKRTVTRFLDAIGYDTLDAGPLAEGWRFQRDTPAYVAPYFDPDGGPSAPGVPVSVDTLKNLLAQAKRYRDM